MLAFMFDKMVCTPLFSLATVCLMKELFHAGVTHPDDAFHVPHVFKGHGSRLFYSVSTRRKRKSVELQSLYAFSGMRKCF
jgi:hypothetical protein